jgi:3-mercaptopyruvate sulfurtransferase SseA
LSFELAVELMEEYNYEKVFVYEGGLPDWEEAGYPVDRSK